MKALIYVLIYLVFMVPTYLIRYLGALAIFADTDRGDFIADSINTMLLICLIALIVIALIRGLAIGKSWLVVFPVIALVFDFVLVFVPLVPTVMHILALVLGSITDNSRKTSRAP